jgi:hypothetical protein
VIFEDDALQLGLQTLLEPTPEAMTKMLTWKRQRNTILKNLQHCGLKLFCFYNRDRDMIYCKVGAGAQKFKDTAAIMRYKLQLKPEYMGGYAEFRADFPGTPALDYSDRRTVGHIYAEHTDEEYPSADAMFSTKDKINLINHIICSRDKDCAGLSMGNLIHANEIKYFFPLHELSVLRDIAAKTRSWLFMPKVHANRVRDYFGEKVAFYFVFMAFYWKWLLVPSGLGLLLQLYDLLMKTPDNATTVPFCIFSAIWTLMMPQFWRREQAKYALAWGTLEAAPDLEPPRPEYYGTPHINPVTKQVEPHFTYQERRWKFASNGVIIVFCGVSLIGSVLATLYARHRMKGQVSGGIVTFQFLLALLVEVINISLSKLSRWLTDRENHRSQRAHDAYHLAKVNCFKFINSYCVLYYIGFFKEHSWLFGTPMTCVNDDCFLDLEAQLAVFTVVRLVLKNVIRFGSLTLNREADEGQHARLSQADLSAAQIESTKQKWDGFSDFEEVLISHGYASFFTVSAPWVYFATLLWTVCELLLDMKDLTEKQQRPVPERVPGIEPWTSVFETYGVIAASTNIALLVFVSKQFAGMRLSHRWLLFGYLLHLLIIAKLLVNAVYPAMPRSVETMKVRQEIIAHRCLHKITVDETQFHDDLSRLRRRGREDLDDPDEFVHPEDIEDDPDPEPMISLHIIGKQFQEALRKDIPVHVSLIIGVASVFILVVSLIYHCMPHKVLFKSS